MNLLHNKISVQGIYNLKNFQDGNTLDNKLEVVEGMKLTRGYISPYFITDQKTQKCVSADYSFVSNMYSIRS